MSANASNTMRRRAPPQGDEEAGVELKLGEFTNVSTLTHSEASLVLNALVQNRKRDKDNKRGESEYVVPFPYPYQPPCQSQANPVVTASLR